MSWNPISANHSIERVLVCFRFSSPLSQGNIANLGESLDGDRDSLGLGSKTIVSVNEVQLHGEHNTEPTITSKRMEGWQFQRRANSGKVSETLSLNPREFIYEATEYSRWNDFLKRYFDVSGSTLVQLHVGDKTDTKLHSLTLEYHDRFVFDGDQQKISPTGLIADPFLRVLPNFIVDQGGPWHLHRGWFVNGGAKNYLVQQNLDIQQGKRDDGQEVMSLAVMTRIVDQEIRENVDRDSIEDILEQMHEISVGEMRMILTSNMQERIGLYGT